MPDSLLRAEHVHVLRHRRTILENVSLSIAPKDFITVIGPNGAGKTMLLKCMMGLFEPDKGTMHRKAGLKIGYMPQQCHVPKNLPLTVNDFLYLHKETTAEHVNLVVDEMNIGHYLDRMLYALSGGEMQRVLLARALIGEPELLVLDEPAQNLDISGQLEFYGLIESIYEARQLAILMVSHDLHMVMAQSRQVVCLYQHICCHGEAQMVAKDPEFIKLFGQDMAKMMAVYHHTHDHTHEGHQHD